ncbi:SCO6745 family protein [Pseudonocardia sp. H11422]|uniref:SCO6745 family protein n=1 Tax=Pseudonocardia sp. H11422 TaxID=2835866 RepID=UPI001BDD18F4|nr:hypothetical protein [Pseudonocardia sp. H11422]
MSDQDDHRARRMWRALEPVHAVTYFAPESKAACDELGTKGYWMSYCALRGAPLGEAPPEVVTALFYNFAPGLIARALPAAWQVASAERFRALRLETVDAALHRLLAPDFLASPEVAEAAELAREAALAAPTAGRALAAANAALDWPEAPHLVLWHAQTILREHRGDGHVAALLTAGLDPVETLVVFAAGTGLDAQWLRERRGWSEQEWVDAAARLVERGLLDPAGSLTPAGEDLRREVEAHTDVLADAPWTVLGEARAERLTELAAPVVSAILAGDGLLLTNPMDLRPLVARPSG